MSNSALQSSIPAICVSKSSAAAMLNLSPGKFSELVETGANAVRKWCDDAGLPKCSAHGLRKACATRLAEAGATEREIMAWTGHNSPTMVQVYAGRARRGLLADHGFEKLIKNEKGSKVDEPNQKGSTK